MNTASPTSDWHTLHRSWPILLLVFVLLSGGVRRDLPLIREVDEPTFVDAAVNAVTGRPDPDWYGHPGSTYFYTLGIVLRGDQLLYGGNNTLAEREAAADPTLTLYGRLVNVWFGLLAAALLVRLGRKLYGGRGGTIGRAAALLMGATPLIIDQITIARTDGITIFFAAASLYALSVWVFLRRITTRNIFAAGLILGLAIATKYQLALFLPLAAAIAVWRTSGNRMPANRTPRKKLPGVLATLGAGTFVAFFAAAPFILIDAPEALRQLAFESRSVHPGADGLTPIQNLAWYLTDALPRAAGPLLPFLIAGTAAALTRRHTPAFLLFPIAGAHLLFISTHPLHWQRWLLPIAPVLALLTADGIYQVQAWLAARHTRPRLNRWPLLLLALVAAWGGYQAWQLSRPSTRIAARAWLLAETERPLRVAYEEYSVDNLDASDIGYIRAFSLAQTRHHSPAALAEQGMAYAVISSEIYERFRPGAIGSIRYTKEWGFYRVLLEEAEPVAMFEPAWDRPGPLIRIYRLAPPG